MAQTSDPGQQAPAGTANPQSQQALIEAVQMARLHLELAMSTLGGGQLSSEAIAQAQARLTDTNSGCNTSCGRRAA